MLAVLTDTQWYRAALIFVSLVTGDCGACFHLLACHPNAFFGEVSVQVLVPFLNWAVCFLTVQLCEFFVYLGHWSFIALSFANVSPSCGLTF